MANVAPWSPYAFEYTPNKTIIDAQGRPVATVDVIDLLSPGYKVGPMQGLSGSMPETPVYAKEVIVDDKGTLVAVVRGIGKVFPPYHVRAVTAAEAAFSGMGNAGIF